MLKNIYIGNKETLEKKYVEFLGFYLYIFQYQTLVRKCKKKKINFLDTLTFPIILF